MSIKKKKTEKKSAGNVFDMFDLSHEVAIVTGGQGMLGSEYAKTLAEAGAAVAVFDKNPNTNPTIQDLKDQGFSVFEVALDLTNKKEVQDAFKRVEKKMGTPTIIINNAGLGTIPNTSNDSTGSFEDYPVEVWDMMMDSHLKSMLFVSQCAVKGMRAASKQGSIINISSTYGIVSPDQSMYEFRRTQGETYFKPAPYSVAKSAVLNFTRWLAEYCGPFGIRVNTLAPGGVYTNDLDPRFVKEYEKRTMNGRMAKLHDYNGAVLFLASKASHYMTGSTLIVDGGWTAK